jgi:hypothetical protein
VGKAWPARRAGNSAILVVLNVKVRMEAQHSIPRPSLHDLLWENITLYILIITKLSICLFSNVIPLFCRAVLSCPESRFIAGGNVDYSSFANMHGKINTTTPFSTVPHVGLDFKVATHM